MAKKSKEKLITRPELVRGLELILGSEDGAKVLEELVVECGELDMVDVAENVITGLKLLGFSVKQVISLD